jgi:transcriptional regulator with XRE-family HTH domain
MKGSTLRTLRRKRGLSIYAVAEAIGVSPPAVSQWELGKRQITPSHVKLLDLLFAGKLGRLAPNPKKGGKRR